MLSYRLVTAGGDTVQVGEEGVTFIGGRGDEDRARSDIFFGLRGAGASFGVVTEFLGGEMNRVTSGSWVTLCPAVKVHPTPETLASVVLVWVASARDLANIQAAAESEAGRRFQFGLYSLYYPKALRQPWLHPLVTPW